MAEAFKVIEDYKDTHLQIFCRGSSGAILAALFVSFLNWNRGIEICHVKKEGERSHSQNYFYINPQNTVIVIDDIIESGETIRSILHYIGQDNFHCLILGDTISNDDYLKGRIGILPNYFISPKCQEIIW